MKRLFLYLLFGFGLTFAQGLPPEAQGILEQARQARQAALSSYSSHYPDKPFWRDAIQYGLEANRLAPSSPEPLRFLAEVYTTTQWYEPAWEAWRIYQRAGGVLDERARSDMTRLGLWLGYNSASKNDLRAAAAYYEAVLELSPDQEEAKIRLALSYMDLGESEAALPYLQDLAARYPENTEYRRLLALAEDRLAFGGGASGAFYEGLELYYQGDIDRALLAFDRATRENPDYKDAFVWAGRTSLELRQPRDAIRYWERATELDPQDEAAAYFLKVSENQRRWGIDAYTAFEEGLNAYQEDRLAEARAAFEEATKENAAYAEAWAWRGRLEFEANNYGLANRFFANAYELEPSNEGYRYFYQEAARQGGLSVPQLAGAPAPAPSPEAPPATTPAAPETTATVPAPTGSPTPSTPAPSSSSPATPTPAETPSSQTSQTPPETPAAPTTSPPASTAQTSPPTTPAPLPAAPETPRPEPEATPRPEREAPSTAVTGGNAVVLLDTTLTHESSNAISFLRVPGSVPRNLQAPANYAGGTLYQRLEVLSKPSDLEVQYQLCLVPNDDISVSPACSSASALSFDASGVYEAQQSLASLSDYGGIDWTKGLLNLMLIVRDDKGDPAERRFLASGVDLSAYYPMQVRYSAVLVPAGGRFAGWP